MTEKILSNVYWCLPAYHQFLQGKGSVEELYTAVKYLEALLPPEGYAVGEYSAADIAITPFLARARVTLSNDLGDYPQGEGPKVVETLTNKQGKYPRFAQYFDDLLARESFKATWDEVGCTAFSVSRAGTDLGIATGVCHRKVQSSLRKPQEPAVTRQNETVAIPVRVDNGEWRGHARIECTKPARTHRLGFRGLF